MSSPIDPPVASFISALILSVPGIRIRVDCTSARSAANLAQAVRRRVPDGRVLSSNDEEIVVSPSDIDRIPLWVHENVRQERIIRTSSIVIVNPNASLRGTCVNIQVNAPSISSSSNDSNVSQQDESQT
jgi:hypothetical protein